MDSDSILDVVKKQLGIQSDYDAFDVDIINFINSAISVGFQMGVGPQDTAFYITGSTETWADYLGDAPYLNMVKDQIFIRVKLMFDPPQTSNVLESYKQILTELDWRVTLAIAEVNDAEEAVSSTL